MYFALVLMCHSLQLPYWWGQHVIINLQLAEYLIGACLQHASLCGVQPVSNLSCQEEIVLFVKSVITEG